MNGKRSSRSLLVALLAMTALAITAAVVVVLGPDAAEADHAMVADSVVMVEPNGRWHVPLESGAERTFFYGNPGDVPLLGDWDGDGSDSPGVFRPSSGFVHLTNSFPADGGVGVSDADLTFYFGMPGDQVVVGDWDGDGVDSLGIRRGSRMLLSNINATAIAANSFTFGVVGDVALAGDPDGDGRDSIFLHRPSNGTVYITRQLPDGTDGVAETNDAFSYGRSGDRAVVGDWDGDGVDTVAVFRSNEATLYLRNDNSQGLADDSFGAGAADWVPVAGRLSGLSGSSTTTSTTPSTTSTTTSSTTTTTSPATVVPPAGFKVAVIGDSGDGEQFRRVLSLIRDQGADIVVHNGDFSYSDGPTSAWTSAIDEILGSEFPYIGSDGNHDDWAQYAGFFDERLASMGATVDFGSVEDATYGFTFNGVRFAFSPEGGDPAHVAGAFAAAPDVAWRIAGWHKNMTAMQVEAKGDEQGWGDYEAAREAGAIITTGHAHSYARTKTLSDVSDQVVALDDRFAVELSSGTTFVVVSGLGGRPPRAQQRCLPAEPPYGCEEWASIYTSSQQATHGALFLTLHVDGDPMKGRGAFINVDREIIDAFAMTVASPG